MAPAGGESFRSVEIRGVGQAHEQEACGIGSLGIRLATRGDEGDDHPLVLG